MVRAWLGLARIQVISPSHTETSRLDPRSDSSEENWASKRTTQSTSVPLNARNGPRSLTTCIMRGRQFKGLTS